MLTHQKQLQTIYSSITKRNYAGFYSMLTSMEVQCDKNPLKTNSSFETHQKLSTKYTCISHNTLH